MKNDHSLNKPNLIFDLDGTLYHFTPAFQQAHFDAAVQTALELGYKGSAEEARKIALLSQAEFGYEMLLFEPPSAEKGRLNEKKLHALELLGSDRAAALGHLTAFHETVQKAYESAKKESRSSKPSLEEFIEKRFFSHLDLSGLEPSHELKHLLETSKLRLGILTHSPQAEALRRLGALKLADCFKKNDVVGIECYREVRKSHGDLGINCIAKIMHIDPADCIFAEDSVKNLEKAHALGMTTVLLRSHNPLTESQSKFVDFKFETPEEMMLAIKKAREKPKSAATAKPVHNLILNPDTSSFPVPPLR